LGRQSAGGALVSVQGTSRRHRLKDEELVRHLKEHVDNVSPAWARTDTLPTVQQSAAAAADTAI